MVSKNSSRLSTEIKGFTILCVTHCYGSCLSTQWLTIVTRWPIIMWAVYFWDFSRVPGRLNLSISRSIFTAKTHYAQLRHFTKAHFAEVALHWRNQRRIKKRRKNNHLPATRGRFAKKISFSSINSSSGADANDPKQSSLGQTSLWEKKRRKYREIG